MTSTSDELVFAPLGGVGEIGMNLSIYGYGSERRKTWMAVDLGVAFAGDDLPGIDLIMPDIRFLVEERRNIAGLVLTHAHEDHFGALLDLWPRLRVPIYATPFTAALIEAKRLSEPGAPDLPVTVVPLGGRIKLGPFDIEFVSVAHSIPESNALVIRTGLGTVLHTGDWKLDPTPVIGPPSDEAKLRALGAEGCLALIGDSTNALREGRSSSETEVAASLAKLIRKPRRGSQSPPLRRTWRACARSPKGREPAAARWCWLAAPWSASPRWRGRRGISMAYPTSAARTPTDTCRGTRWWRCAPAARASRAPRSPASPRTSTPTSPSPRATGSSSRPAPSRATRRRSAAWSTAWSARASR
jgi:glyoxylase-like metal-dependent hydrolase (beta-lactamase superfamily II)